MTGIIAQPLGQLLFALYSFIGNYGITLIVFTFIVRGFLFPLYADQIKHSSKLQDVQPKIKEIQAKYAGDKETLNAKMMELYKEEKVNPARGCLPLVIQMPIIIGLFSLLRNPVHYIDNPSMLMAIHENFLWIPDLSQPDLWVLPILAGITTYISFSQTQTNPQMAGNPTMVMMKYVFPIMIVWWGRSFPAGLSLYWFIGTFVQIFQTMALNKWKENLKKKAANKETNKQANQEANKDTKK
ncbi:MAG: YidC/Oxa1 family membrane protein insertase [Eubacteriales bacterium]